MRDFETPVRRSSKAELLDCWPVDIVEGAESSAPARPRRYAENLRVCLSAAAITAALGLLALAVLTLAGMTIEAIPGSVRGALGGLI